ncbi:MAG: 1,4-alpha-glucan branching protein GlgB [Clostridiales bacterium]|nr:1,4-alpha-glucan branching protein GlgB [Clostridiales bacterium]
MDQGYLFNTGKNHQSYNFLGSFPFDKEGEIKGYRFAVWAPRAHAVYVVGDFNDWSEEQNPLVKNENTGIWQGSVDGAKQWDRYKYRIVGMDDRVYLKGDPFARHFETRPRDASILYDPDDYSWTDEKFCSERVDAYTARPINIYEMHLGSWRRHADGNFMNYREIAGDLADYCLEMGYTHVELMPIMEHPLDDSWGYQITGFYAATSRFGTPADFKFFVDHLHRNNISVILDWVPAHFPKNLEGLVRFDGSICYEYEDPRIGEHREWGTYVFDYSKAEVRSFLMSNVVFWVKEFHVDGIRVDAVSSMIYRNYGRTEYLPNEHGGVDNYEAVEFIRQLNTVIREKYPHVMMIAEESTSWQKVTHEVSDGGLGFTHKWNMGWMHDTLDYFETDSYARMWHHDQFCFSMTYAFSENFILSLSHDEVVHGKRSLLDKMPGDIWRKFASLRTLYMYMMAHPGAKLLFMGSEFAPFIEWRFYEELEWFLLDYDTHRALKAFSADLNRFYLSERSLWIKDRSWEGFEWVNISDRDNSVFIFRRMGDEPGRDIYVVLNMIPVPLIRYKIPIAEPGRYEVVLNSDSSCYGGSGYLTTDDGREELETKDGEWNGKPYYLEINLPPLCGLYIRKTLALEEKPETKDQ